MNWGEPYFPSNTAGRARARLRPRQVNCPSAAAGFSPCRMQTMVSVCVEAAEKTVELVCPLTRTQTVDPIRSVTRNLFMILRAHLKATTQESQAGREKAKKSTFLLDIEFR